MLADRTDLGKLPSPVADGKAYRSDGAGLEPRTSSGFVGLQGLLSHAPTMAELLATNKA